MLDGEGIQIGTIYVDVNGKQVRVTSTDKENVQWASLDGTESNVNIENFPGSYRPQSEAA
jgi:hypothetical protein